MSERDGNQRRIVAFVDREAALVTLTRPDRSQVIAEWPHDRFDESSSITTMTYEVGGDRLYFETRHGDSLSAELPTLTDPSPINGRLVIYVDQNHWSTLANTLHDPARVPVARRAIAERLIALAQQRRLILPMSAAHLSETCQWADDDRRYRLALTILQLSAGWQMRDPLTLRRHEIQQSLLARVGRSLLPTRDAFTLEPGAIYEGFMGPCSPAADLPPELALVSSALTETSTIFDVMLDRQSVRPLEVPGWAENLQGITDSISQGPRDRELRRESTRVAFLSDLIHEVAAAALQAGIAETDCLEWLDSCSDESIRAMSSLGVQRTAAREAPGSRHGLGGE